MFFWSQFYYECTGKRRRDYQDLRAETLKVIQGNSHFNADLLNGLIDETTAQLKELEGQMQAAELELRETISVAEQVSEEYTQLMNWTELYDNCSMLMDKVTDSSNSVVQERYVTLSVHRKNIEEARAFFDRVTADITTRLSHLDAHSEELDAVEGNSGDSCRQRSYDVGHYEIWGYGYPTY